MLNKKLNNKQQVNVMVRKSNNSLLIWYVFK